MGLLQVGQVLLNQLVQLRRREGVGREEKACQYTEDWQTKADSSKDLVNTMTKTIIGLLQTGEVLNQLV